jgi:hypothetical protein
MLTLPAREDGERLMKLNQTFTATQGDFCVKISFPADAAQLSADIGVAVLATDNANYWLALVRADGKITLHKRANNKWSMVWEAVTNNLFKTGPTDMNSVRVVVKNGTITVIVNGRTVKSVGAQIPGGDFKLGFFWGYNKPSATPVLFPVRSYKVTAAE